MSQMLQKSLPGSNQNNNKKPKPNQSKKKKNRKRERKILQPWHYGSLQEKWRRILKVQTKTRPKKTKNPKQKTPGEVGKPEND